MGAKRKAKIKVNRKYNVQVSRLCGYVALTVSADSTQSVLGWIYLRRHSPTELFVGNLPIPSWMPFVSSPSQTIPAGPQKKMKSILRKMVAGAKFIGDIFSTGNGRLASRVSMKDGETGVNETLESPKDHLYMEFWNQLYHNGKDSVIKTYLEEYSEERDTQKVVEWSNAAMKAYEVREQEEREEKERRERMGGAADEDGFVTVTSGAKQIKATEAQILAAGKGKFRNRGAKRRKSLLDTRKGIEKDGFYRWQRRTDSMVSNLQKKFRDDCKRITAIRGLQME